jgi:hypothetical protein
MTKQDWQRKDMLNSRMSALKAAAFVLEGSFWSGEDVLKQADEYFQWLTQDQEWIPKTVEPKVTPTPTAKQKKLLDAVLKKLGMDYHDFVNKGCSFPNNQAEAKKLYESLKG